MTAPTKYRVLVHYDSDRSLYVARAPELEHCSAEGESRSEAIGKVEEEIDAQLHNIRERGGQVPAAVDDDASAGEGPLSAKLSRSLHRDLLWQARVEGVDLDQLVAELLAAGLESRRARRRPGQLTGPGRPAQPGNQAPAGDDEQPPRRDSGGPPRRGFGREQGGGGRHHHLVREVRAAARADPGRGRSAPAPGRARTRGRWRGPP